MPANLTPEYKKALEVFQNSVTPHEKLQALDLMLATIPKHKGTEKMQADIKRKISKLKDTQLTRKAGGKKESLCIEKQGAAQLVMAGLPNSGKSSLLSVLTNALPEIADFSFTTRKPLPGMMIYERVQIQLVDTPPLDRELTEGWVMGILRMADLLILVVDLSKDPLAEIEDCRQILLENRIYPVGLNWHDSGDPRDCFKKTLILGSKLELPDSRDNYQVLLELYQKDYPMIGVSAAENLHLEEFKRLAFDQLGIIRVFTKLPGKKPEYSQPFILGKGSKIKEMADVIHKDFAQKFKFARIWGEGKFDGQKVNLDFPLEDKDVVELHV